MLQFLSTGVLHILKSCKRTFTVAYSIFIVAVFSNWLSECKFRLNRFAYIFGGTNSACNWLRLPRLCLSYVVLFKQSSTATTRDRRNLTNLFYIVGATTHITACGWFFIGNNYEVKQLCTLSIRARCYSALSTFYGTFGLLWLHVIE